MATDLQYLEVPCQRQISDSTTNPYNFSQGIQDYVYSIGKGQTWFPSKSYFRATVQLKGNFASTNNIPVISEQLALAENCVANMYSSAYFLAGGQNVSSIVNYLPQAAQVENRVNCSNAWLKSIGQSALYTNPNFSSRVSSISSSTATVVSTQSGAVSTLVSSGLDGINLDEGKDQFVKPIVPGTAYSAAVLTVSAGTAPVSCSIVNGAFDQSHCGATLYRDGLPYIISAVNAPVGGSQTIGFLHPFPPIVGGAQTTLDWYVVQRNLTRSTENHSYLQVLWKPTCLGIFNHPDPLGAGDYRIQLAPDANYKFNAVETTNSGFSTAYTYYVVDMKFYAAIAKMTIPDSIQTLFLNEFQCQSKTMTTNDQNLSFTVPASTTSLHVFLQSGVAGSSPNFPPSAFKAENNADLNLLRLQITYANISRPQTIWSSGWTNGNVPASAPLVSQNLLTQLYYQSTLENGMDDNIGGNESINDWLARGALYSFTWSKPEGDRSTEVQLQITYNATNADGLTAFPTNSKIFLVAKYSRTVEITTSQGMVSAVRSLNI